MQLDEYFTLFCLFVSFLPFIAKHIKLPAANQLVYSLDLIVVGVAGSQ